MPPVSPIPDVRALTDRWAWFLGLGIVLLVLGLLASIYIFSATLVSVLFLGILVLIGGVSQLGQAWRLKQHWTGFIAWSVSGLFYVAAGVLAIVDPVAGAAAFTLLFGALLIGSGAFRLWTWFPHRGQSGWGWIAFSGFITLLAGLLIAAAWPGNSAWILGLILALDLLFQGWTLIFLGFTLRAKR